MENVESNQDCVIFMTAYKINKYKKKMLKRKNLPKENALKKCHIESIATSQEILTSNGVIGYTRNFDEYTHTTSFNFEIKQKNKTVEDYREEIKNISWIFNLAHSIELVLDSQVFDVPIYITVESFLVSIGNRILQVDPLAFFINDVLFVNYELIDYNTGVALQRDEVLERKNNYHIIRTEKVSYCGERGFHESDDKISDIIFYNIAQYFELIGNMEFTIDNFSFIHNIFVVSESIGNIDKYFLDVLGVNDSEFKLKNININNEAYKYFSQEYLGVVTDINGDDYQQAMFDGQSLEVLKMYFILKQINNFDITNDLESTLDRQFELERLIHMTRVPIITLNAIENMKRTHTFKQYDEAIRFKTSYLRLCQEKRKNKNGVLLNVLLAVLALMSGIGAIPVITSTFGVPPKVSFIVLLTVFAVFIAIWIKSEVKR